ncbi:MAG: ABC transporter permease [Candidatus Kerfeldbacteria bacterium]|nr:ABC transporter permease [Candidatus Kerfeldbacteria bacterium]
MIFVSFYRASTFALQNFWRNLWLSLVTILILTLTLYSISIVLTLNYVTDQAIRIVKEKVDVDIFFDLGVPEKQIIEAQTFLKNMSEVKEVQYISADQALENFRTEHADDADIQAALAELDENPLQDSLIVKAHQVESYTTILSRLDQSEFAEIIESKDFDDSQEVIDTISSASNTITRAGYVLSGIFIFIAVVVVFNTVRLAIYAQSKEIGIMRLVGATNWFIRSPFLLEAILYGCIAALIVLGLLFFSVQTAAPYLNNFFAGYEFDLMAFFRAQYLTVFLAELAIAVLLSIVSSMIAIGRYLRA